MSFQNAINKTLSYEGGYVNHPSDPGGATNYGITWRFARAKGYKGDMRNLSLAQAVQWYKESIWDRYDLFFIDRASPDVAGYLFDMAVNHGQWTRIVQTAVRRFEENIVIDGIWGPQTLQTVVVAAKQYPLGVLDALRVERCRYVIRLIDNKNSLKVFLLGWVRRYLS